MKKRYKYIKEDDFFDKPIVTIIGTMIIIATILNFIAVVLNIVLD